MNWLFGCIPYGDIPGIIVGMQKEKKKLLNKKKKTENKIQSVVFQKHT